MFLRPLVPALLLLASPALAVPQAPDTTPVSDETPAAEASPPVAPPSLDAAVEVEADELESSLEGASEGAVREALDTWMASIEQLEVQLAAVLAAPEGSPQREQEARLRSDRDALLARAELVLEELEQSGGSAPEVRERLEDLRDHSAGELVDYSTVPADLTVAQNLQLEVLRAKLRPLTREQVEDQLAQWMQLLQEKSLEVRNVEVAALQSEDSAEVEKFNARAVELRGQRGRLIERTRAVVDALEKKNGEVADARAYLKSIVVTPPIAGWRAAWTTARAWLVSPDGGIDLGLGVGKALGVFMIFWFLSRVVVRIAQRAMNSMKQASALLREFVVSFAGRGVVLIGVLLAANQLGVNMGPLLAIIGAAGLVVGLALQGTLSNFASGLLIMVYRPYDVGDVVDAGGVSGKVEGMTLMTTLVRTFDNRTMNVPNNKVWGDVITNVTANSTRRVDMIFGISYEDDVDRAKEVLLDVVRDHESVLAEPEPVVRVHTLNDSSVDFIVRPWVNTPDYWNVYWDVTTEVKRRFDREGISIPFPQRDVHVHQIAREAQVELPRPQEPKTEKLSELSSSNKD